MADKFDAVLFDWDGTIVDSSEGIFNSVRYAIHKFDIPDKPDEELAYFIGPPLYDGFATVFGVDEAMASTLTDTYREYYRDRGIFEVSVYDGVADLLAALHGAGVKTAVVSSKPQEFLERLVEHLGFADLFDAVIGPSMTNHNSDKSVLVERALGTLGVDKERAAMVGDRKFDMAGAKTAGVSALGILWGYGDAEELTAAGADAVFETPADLQASLTL